MEADHRILTKRTKDQLAKFQGLILREKTKWWKAPKGGGTDEGLHVHFIQTFNSCNSYSIHNCNDYPGEEFMAGTSKGDQSELYHFPNKKKNTIQRNIRSLINAKYSIWYI